jgi:hypothetical protein
VRTVGLPDQHRAGAGDPKKNEIKKNSIGKIDEAAASAWTPIMRPRKMLVNIPDADCSMLETISGMRKTSIVRQIGLVSSMAAPRRCMSAAFVRKDVVPAAAKDDVPGD